MLNIVTIINIIRYLNTLIGCKLEFYIKYIHIQIAINIRV